MGENHRQWSRLGSLGLSLRGSRTSRFQKDFTVIILSAVGRKTNNAQILGIPFSLLAVCQKQESIVSLDIIEWRRLTLHR